MAMHNVYGTFCCRDIEVLDEDGKLITTIPQIYVEIGTHIRDSAQYISEKLREIVWHLVGPIDFDVGDSSWELLE